MQHLFTSESENNIKWPQAFPDSGGLIDFQYGRQAY